MCLLILQVNCNPPCSHQIILNNASCYDKCHCHVRSIIRQNFVNKYMNWSNVSTCNIGPTGMYYCAVGVLLITLYVCIAMYYVAMFIIMVFNVLCYCTLNYLVQKQL